MKDARDDAVDGSPVSCARDGTIATDNIGWSASAEGRPRSGPQPGTDACLAEIHALFTLISVSVQGALLRSCR
jgi:hypothetical protein